jgi:hypothetical protein
MAEYVLYIPKLVIEEANLPRFYLLFRISHCAVACRISSAKTPRWQIPRRDNSK